MPKIWDKPELTITQLSWDLRFDGGELFLCTVNESTGKLELWVLKITDNGIFPVEGGDPFNEDAECLKLGTEVPA